jgi:hypothetical protein
MNDNAPFMRMEVPCEEAVTSVSQQMSRAGMSVQRTFDLKQPFPQIDCPCPHHRTEQCDCQMIVLLVYADDRGPVSLVAHGYEGKTWFSIVDTPQQHADSDLFAFIQQTLAPAILIPVYILVSSEWVA